MREIDEAYTEFREDLSRESESSGEPEQVCFFRAYADLAAENGDCLELNYSPVRRETGQAFQIDGYALDLERAELHVAVCDLRTEPKLQSLIQAGIDGYARRAERFIANSLRPEFVNSLEEASPAFEAAYPIHEAWHSIKRVRIVIFSNARLASRKKTVESKELLGCTFTYNVLDFSRYVEISASRDGSEPIEIRLCDLEEDPIPCLEAHAGGGHYASYLVAMPGELLAKIYGLYGPRLLEQNVRTFLQARTKVNRGIIETLNKSPEMFFAYNNGLTATAAGISTVRRPDGTVAIESFRNLQIVNGGQTTASILYAKDKGEADLSQVYVQMKLSVVAPDEIDDVVPRISRFANTQNRISEADFFSSHPFHLEMERISRRLSAPPKGGALASSKWFYERARGQYKDQLGRTAGAVRRKFLLEYPRDQVIVKTDLAKIALTFQCAPHVVSQGAQKCFLAFAEQTGPLWVGDRGAFHEAYFKEVVAKAIVFRWTDRMIGRSGWYAEARGYKANVVTYTVAWLIDQLSRRFRMQLDLQRVWMLQDVPEELKEMLSHCAPIITAAIRRTPSDIQNVSEYCKRQSCWAAIQQVEIPLGEEIHRACIRDDEVRARKKEARSDGRLDSDVEFETYLVGMAAHAQEVRTFAARHRLLSPRSSGALEKLGSGAISWTRQERNALRYLFSKMEEAGFRFPV